MPHNRRDTLAHGQTYFVGKCPCTWVGALALQESGVGHARVHFVAFGRI